MALIKSVRGISPRYEASCWFADNATVVGEVIMGEECTVWFGAVVRGDVHYIQMGDKVNIQDNATIHGTFEKSPTTIGNCVSIGHNAIIHGCTLQDNVLIGMGAIIMDDAVVGEGSIVAAGSVVLAKTKIPPHSVYGGVPAKLLKKVDATNQEMLTRIANNYPMYAGWFKE